MFPNLSIIKFRYVEIETTPFKKLFVKNVYKDDDIFERTPIDCKESGISVSTDVSFSSNNWNATATVPFELILGDDYAKASEIKMKGNYYRIGKIVHNYDNILYIFYDSSVNETKLNYKLSNL